MASPRILVVDDDVRMCRAWRGWLAPHEFQLSLVHDLSGARAALAARRFDIVFVDLQLERACGLELLDEINRLRPRPVVAIASGHIDAQVATRCAGQVFATLPKPIDRWVLASFIAKVEQVRGGDARLHRFRRMHRLSARETEALGAGLGGLTNKEAAERMGCSASSVAAYWRRICRKTGCPTKAKAICAALDALPPPRDSVALTVGGLGPPR